MLYLSLSPSLSLPPPSKILRAGQWRRPRRCSSICERERSRETSAASASEREREGGRGRMNEARSLNTLPPKGAVRLLLLLSPLLRVLLFLVKASLGVALDLKTVAAAASESVCLGATRLTRNNGRCAGAAVVKGNGDLSPSWDGTSRPLFRMKPSHLHTATGPSKHGLETCS